MEFPYNGKLFKSKKKAHEETILFVPFFGAEQRELLRHVRLVNDLGYDAVLFDLERTPLAMDFSKGLTTPLKNLLDLKANFKIPISSQMKFGLKHVFADQIENMLNLIPGKKIVYAFSNPSAAAIEAMARRHCYDVVSLICDSGPSGKFAGSAKNLYRDQWKVAWPIAEVLSPILAVAWSPQQHKDVHADLETFPKGFKVLSIRGWKDKLIPPDHIDAIFEPHHNIDWRKLSLPEADHLVGLRDFRNEYVPSVEKFLKETSHDKGQNAS